MNNRLQSIITHKHCEVARLQTFLEANPQHTIHSLLRGEQQREAKKSFKQALLGPGLRVIAEIKRKSPSKGDLATIADPVRLAQEYRHGGANAFSILTDSSFFKGALQDMQAVASADKVTPILRKDFIVDVSQIAEAIVAGADAILAIVAVLGEKTRAILSAAKLMNIEVLVEVHTQKELDLALNCGAEIIGINNRNLSTFVVNPQCALDLIAEVPPDAISVAESGISDPKLAKIYYEAGFSAVLIGEALVTSTHPADFIRACRYDQTID